MSAIQVASLIPFVERPLQTGSDRDLELSASCCTRQVWTILPAFTGWWWTVPGQCGQATKGIRWMTWRTEAKKDGVTSDMLRGAGKQAVIRRFLNEETHLRRPECIGPCERTQGTETSHVPAGTEREIDSVSSGERTRKSPNQG